ncbi:MAG: thiamine pyrophosphate-dependent dehydrogenase E1 component subunit alpha [Actinomycetota bacterium]|nr:thiamine pyrophosphate-dependent dehydrogenase E1 component subunit alpha [Actinomycetota bacterium]
MDIDKQIKVEMLRDMLKIRMFEEKIRQLYLQGYITGSMHLSTGQEAIPVGFCANLNKDDYILSSHRGHHHIIAKGGEYKYMMAELFGKSTGYCKGKGGSMHIACADIGVLGANGVVGGGICIAAGVGFASKYLKDNKVTVSFFGDGAANTGAFHEGVNFAAVRKSNVVFVIENNQYAISVPRKLSDCVDKQSVRAAGYGIPGVTIDGNDVLEVYKTAAEAIKRARSGNGPSLIECMTYRWHGHHAGEPKDGILYRSKEEINFWKEKDPIKRLKDLLLKENLLTENDYIDIENNLRKELNDSIEFAKESPFPEPEALYKDVYVDFKS